MTWDKITDLRISSLNPLLQPIATDFINYFDKFFNMYIRITCGFRSNEDQHKSYLQGRETPGVIITYADSGMSFHNYGLAFDICRIINSEAFFNIPTVLLKVSAFKFKLKWGGTFPHPDNLHFEKNFGHSISYYKEQGLS
jgi:peptidoglycan L-alanyl-D-glutamate endopeptidase CwlK